jgi:putative membrane protein
MTFTKGQWTLLFFNAIYVVGFGSYYVQNFNYEFIAYAGLIVAIVALIYGTLHYTKFPTYIIAGLSIWGLLHMMGGSVETSDGVLYAWRVYPFFDGGGDFYILKFDQVVHGALYAVVALMFLHLLKNIYLLEKYEFLTAFIAVMAALGVSALNEIFEFTAVLIAPETGVGGYENTMLDVVFNFGGALLAVLGYYLVKGNVRDSTGAISRD